MVIAYNQSKLIDQRRYMSSLYYILEWGFLKKKFGGGIGHPSID
jgi:hypothetical protein